MKKVTKTWLPTVVAAAALTFVFALLALVLYTRTERGVVERHSRDQHLLATLAATALAQRVDDYFHKAEAAVATLRELPESEWSAALADLAPVAEEENLFLLRPGQPMDFRRPPRHPAALEDVLRPWRGAQQPVLSNPFPLGAPDRQVALLIPLQAEGRPAGQLGFLLPFDALVESLFARGLKLEFSLCLLDEQGRVLEHARHPEMVGRRLPEPGQTCQPCHTSFALERQMVAGETGVDQLQVGNQPLALVAFSPVEVLERRWSLALSEPYSTIIADTRQGFRGITLLLALSLIVGIVATAFTLQNRAQRRRAEERARQAERRAALEQQLRQSEQLASIGKMTSQIAHEINTPLAALGLNVSYLRTEVGRRLGNPSAEIQEVCDAIVEEINRLKRVIHDYLRFSRLPQAAPARESLHELVESYVEFVEVEAHERSVRLETDLGLESAEVRLDADLFRQAFLNLVRNSFEAMPEGGTLRVRLQVVNGEAVLRLEDTGRGIADEALPHIFDPFFTTKKEGTGLGLAHVRRVVEEHGGTIECTSQAGRGTAFVVRLPTAETEPRQTKERLAS